MAVTTLELRKSIARDMRAVPAEGDWYGEDGLLVCGRCGTPKECRVPVCGNGALGYMGARWEGGESREVIRPIMCSCREREAADADMAEAAFKAGARDAANRAACWDIGGCSSMTFDADDGSDPVASGEARAYAEGFPGTSDGGRGLVFLGGVGCGKTFMAACIANRLLDSGAKVRFTSISELARRASASGYGGSSEAVGSIRHADLVVLDDFGTERQTPSMQEFRYQVVNTLYSERVPMVVTTNLTRRELMASTGAESDRVFSRIVERCRPVVMAGADRRKMV